MLPVLEPEEDDEVNKDLHKRHLAIKWLQNLFSEKERPKWSGYLRFLVCTYSLGTSGMSESMHALLKKDKRSATYKQSLSELIHKLDNLCADQKVKKEYYTKLTNAQQIGKFVGGALDSQTPSTLFLFFPFFFFIFFFWFGENRWG